MRSKAESRTVLVRFGMLRAGFLIAFVVSFLAAGCTNTHPPITTSRPSTTQLSPPVRDADLDALVTPPIGWKPDPIKITDKSRHRVWLSPTGSTAFGVIYFDLPLPVGSGLALSGFLREMKKTEGDAELISRIDDSTLGGIRFVADGGLYRIRCNLTTSGFHGWAVYAGTLRAKPVNAAELSISEQARETTRVNAP